MPPPSLWRPRPLRLALLLFGLWLFGTGEASLVAAKLGNSPWTVLAQGVARHTPLGIGSATIAISLVVLAVWIPLRQAPGLGTVLNAIVIGLAIAVMLPVLPSHPAAGARIALLAGGIALVATGSGFYLGSRLGPGPRDGLMTGLVRRTGRSVRLIRTSIEVIVLVTGWLLGGTVGLGTVVYAVSIGPLLHRLLPLLTAPRSPRSRPSPAPQPAR
jgi:uncharacterized membrane protein YczE